MRRKMLSYSSRCLYKNFIPLITLSIYILANVTCFNVYTQNPIVKYKAAVSQGDEKGRGYFGMSIAIHKETSNNKDTYWLLVGAPFNHRGGHLGNIDPTGDVFKCRMSMSLDDCDSIGIFFTSTYKYSLLGMSVLSANLKAKSPAYVCAPNRLSGGRTRFGTCYSITNDLGSMGDPSSVSQHEIIAGSLSADEEHDMNLAQRCFGHSLATDGKVFYVGGPNFYYAQGAVATVGETTNFYTNTTGSNSREYDQSLFGYSISLGKIFKQDNLQEIVIGAPGVSSSGTGGGRIIVASILSSNNGKILIRQELHGEHFGSGLGYSVLALDLNNDGVDEVIGGAPFTIKDKALQTGAVYIYQLKAGTLQMVKKLNPQVMESFFGMALANLGDINKDGFNDFAVGAPFENEGVVYIYEGSASGIPGNPMQIITPKSLGLKMKSFGTSIVGNIDIDGNGYPDVAIGSPMSKQAVVLRTRPIADITFSSSKVVSSSPLTVNDLPPKKDFFTMSPYLMYVYRKMDSCPPNAPSGKYNMTIEIDPGRTARAKFDTPNGLFMVQNFDLFCNRPTPASLNDIKIIILKDTFADRVDPLVLQINYTVSLPNPDPNYKQIDGQYLNQFPINDVNKQFMTYLVPFKHPCEDTCYPSLKRDFRTNIKKFNKEYALFVGEDEIIWVNVTLKNEYVMDTTHKREAHNVVFNVNYSSSFLEFVSAEPGPKKFQMGKIRCMLSERMQMRNVSNCFIKFRVSVNLRDSATPYLYINTSITTDKTAKINQNFNEVMKIRLKMHTDIKMLYSVDSTGLIYSSNTVLGASAVSQEQKIGPDFKLKIQLSNSLNNSIIHSSRLVIMWPYEVVGDVKEAHGKYLLYLLSKPSVVSKGPDNEYHNVTCDEKTLKQLENVLGIRKTNDKVTGIEVLTGSVWTPKEITLPPLKPSAKSKQSQLPIASDNEPEVAEGTARLDCATGTARCKLLTCQLGSLSRKTGTITLLFNARIWEHTLIEDYKTKKYVESIVNLFWRPDVNFDIVPKSNQNSVSVSITVSNNMSLEAKKPKNMTLIICISVVVGLIILILIILILWKCKFFQRKTSRLSKAEHRPVVNYDYDE